MSESFIHAPEQTSRFNTFVIGAMMTAVLVLSAVLFFSPFAA
ncbi:MAG: hypothetical protein ABSD74_06325 [Rhizomicrobium sp.]|jgi:hypothetical protein